MTLYQKLEALQKMQQELSYWREEIKSGRCGGAGIVDILEKLITQIVVLKVEIGIKTTI